MDHSNIREMALEVPITGRAQNSLIRAEHGQLHVIQVLEFRSTGYSLLCIGTEEDLKRFNSTANRTPGSGTTTRILDRRKDGSLVFIVSGEWDQRREDDMNHEKAMELFRAMEKVPIYSLNGPKINNGTLQVTIMAEEEHISRLVEGLGNSGISYRILKIRTPKVKVDPILDSLTQRQKYVLNLAYSLGYYDVPRRTRLEDIAGILKMDKGTIGEHLRRAEKHVFDILLGV